MINILNGIDENSKILLLGLGREGLSSYRYIRKLYPNTTIYITDINEIHNDELVNVVLYVKDEYLKDLESFDVVLKSPGIVLREEDLKRIKRLESQTSFFLRSLGKQTIGITGTKGKSTTTSLIYHLLHECDENTFLVGNIGIPCFDILEKVNDESTVVFELSCHQLEYTKESPHIAILLNFYEEHLDHYGSYENYKNAKRHIYQYQSNQDFLFVNSNIKDTETLSHITSVGFDDMYADVDILGRKIITNNKMLEIKKEDTHLLGDHNVYNIGMAYAVCAHLGMDVETFKANLKTFAPLHHRLEYIGKVNEVSYYDDSISTACETAISALKSVDQVDTIIIGGMDRGINYETLENYLMEFYENNIIFIPDSGIRVYNELKERGADTSKYYVCANLEEAVKEAKRITRANMSCVLSPASASYGFYKNFEERGDFFKKYVFEN